MKREDLTGQKFGRLTVLTLCDVVHGKARWNCSCDCGGSTIAFGANLKRGNTLGCGCVRRERTGDANRRHGQTKTPEHHVWQNMRQRCTNQRNKAYGYYGGRGISVCQRWDSFENFIADMGPRPSSKHSIERKDVNGNYEPGNCRWATAKEQMNNTRRNRLVEYQDRTQTLAQWCDELGLKSLRVMKRLDLGWSPEEAFTVEPYSNYSAIKIDGVTKHLNEWCRKTGVSASSVINRIKRGWSVRDAVLTPTLKTWSRRSELVGTRTGVTSQG